MKYCMYCGNNLPDDVIFCNKCGKKQETEQVSGEEIAEENEKVWLEKGANIVKENTFKEEACGETAELGSYEEAIEYLDKAINIDPENSSAWCVKGIALNKLERYEEAIECFDKAIKINPENSLAWVEKAHALNKLYNDKGYEEAIECSDKSIKINPEDLEGWIEKGIALNNLKKHEEAIKCFDRIININPEYAKAWQEKAVVLKFWCKRRLEARKCFKKYEELRLK